MNAIVPPTMTTSETKNMIFSFVIIFIFLFSITIKIKRPNGTQYMMARVEVELASISPI